ncbi:MAG: FHA domain-containing protein [Acidobacteriota bacterium]|nr:FHA domain-containing protein [Acidobacteriota bacterium]
MREIIFTYPTPEGSKEIALDGEKISFGRGSEADFRFPDDGLSRLHATVYSDGGSRVWIVDENSSNGSFVNGVKVTGSGTPLNNGDTIKIGHFTNLKVRISEKQTPAQITPNNQNSNSVSASAQNPAYLIPVAVIAVALFVFSISAVFIGYTVLGNSKPEIVQTDDPDDFNDEPNDEKEKDATPTPTATPKAEKTAATVSDNTSLTDSPEAANTGANVVLPAGKKYLEMSDSERRQYLEAKAMRVAQIIGNSTSDKIPSEAIDKIKGFADGFARRINVKSLSTCKFGDSLQVTYERASKNAPFIVRAFNEKGIDPRIGLYLAMIESEHCVCLQSPTGPLGMFQFTFATAKIHFEPSEGVIKGASPSSPDDRCKPEPAARAAASYMKALTGRYGTGPASVPLAIGSYNSGEGGLSTNLQKALDANEGLPRDFWTLISKGEILSKQFQSENFKYVPKFFAAAIIGENPQDFGLKLQPLSTYSK